MPSGILFSGERKQPNSKPDHVCGPRPLFLAHGSTCVGLPVAPIPLLDSVPSAAQVSQCLDLSLHLPPLCRGGVQPCSPSTVSPSCCPCSSRNVSLLSPRPVLSAWPASPLPLAVSPGVVACPGLLRCCTEGHHLPSPAPAATSPQRPARLRVSWFLSLQGPHSTLNF